jgi:tetratricopeptide (TPR) repeat protein
MDDSQHDRSLLRRVIAQGEGAKVEFKESLGFDATTGASNPKIVHAILKTIAAFLNTNGGTILIGVTDTGQVRGVERDYAHLGKKNADGFQLRLRDLFHSHLTPPPLSSIRVTFVTMPEGTVCRVDVGRSAHVVHVNEKEVYVRDGNTTRKLDGRELTDWVSQRTRRRRVHVLGIAIALIGGLIFSYTLLKPVAALPTKPPRPGVDEPLHPCALPTPPPETPQARLAYNEGCQKIRLLDYPAARALFEKASAIEPQNPAIRLALADAWSWLGYEERADQECKNAIELSNDLPPEPALWARGRCYEIDNDYDRAITTYRALWALSPENLEYGLQLVSAQTDAEDGAGAMATINKLRTMPLPARNDPRIDLSEAQAAELLDDSPRQRTAAQAAINKSQSGQQRLLAAEAKRWLGMAYKDLGESAKAKAAFREAKDTFSALGDRMGAALVQHELAEMLEEEGAVDEALLFYRETVRFYTQIGNTTYLASALNDIADILTRRGDITGAITAYDRALAVAASVRDKSGERTALERKADLLVWQGDLHGAKKLYQGAVAIARNNNQKAEEVDAMDSLASLLIMEGELASAAKICQEVRAINEAIGKRSTQTASWRSSFDLLFATGHTPQAETLAHDAVQESAKDHSLLRQTTAEDLLARSLFAQGKATKAQDAISHAAVLAQRSKDLHARLTVAITSARIRAAQGDPSNAEKELVGVLDEAKQFGLFDLHLDATMAIADLQLRQGQQDHARILLTTLEADATAHGFNLIAAQAADARRHQPLNSTLQKKLQD